MTDDSTPKDSGGEGQPKRRGSSSKRRRRPRRRGGAKAQGQENKDQPHSEEGGAAAEKTARARPTGPEGGPPADGNKRSRGRRRRRRGGGSGGEQPQPAATEEAGTPQAKRTRNRGDSRSRPEPRPRGAGRPRAGGRRREAPPREQPPREQPPREAPLRERAHRERPLEEEPAPREVEPYFLATISEDPILLAEDEPDYDWREAEQLYNVVIIRFNQSGMLESFDAGDKHYDKGEQVVVETDKGLQLGDVMVSSRLVMRSGGPLPRVIRTVTPNDERQEKRNQEKEQQAFKLCQQLASEYKLPLKLIDVDYLHGGNRAIFFFSSEGRVDFRQLVRELASKLHTRIEMRQVGVRDASRHIGGIGPCGQQLCCNSFLSRFAPVSIRMAKDQNLVLNPQKVSGVCGRLMCCLTYEQKGYEHLRKGLPKPGKRIELSDGRVARVRDVDVLRRLVRAQLEDGTFEIFGADDVKPIRGGPAQKGPASAERPERKPPGDPR